MALAPGSSTRHPHASARRHASTQHRPTPHTATGARSPSGTHHHAALHGPRGASQWHWLWAGLALALGMFIAAAGWIAYASGPVVVLAALFGLVARRRWARTTLWVGLGLTLGVGLFVVLSILQPTGHTSTYLGL